MEVVPYFKMLKEELKRLLKFIINCPNFKEIHKAPQKKYIIDKFYLLTFR